MSARSAYINTELVLRVLRLCFVMCVGTYIRRYEDASHGIQGLLWPGEEPVDARIVHHPCNTPTPSFTTSHTSVIHI